jgi:peptidoglycan/xylan/chitin deacetylase (PgdA/CDA1 family)
MNNKYPASMKYIIFFLTIFTASVFPQEEVFLGGIIRGDKSEKNIHIVMTSHEFIDGFDTISSVLNKHNIKASFFFTGDFYREPEFKNVILSLKDDGHYLGAHSDKHILYCTWEKRDSTLVTKDEYFEDVLNNYAEMERFGITKEDAPFYLPPYEWYNQQISDWTKELGLILVNFTPGTSSNQDWTIPSMDEKYLSSDTIYTRIMAYEEKDPAGLNGFILFIHFGTHPERTDKFYFRLDELITSLKAKGYEFKLLSETIKH